ncbi:hypothetical protein [Dyadobacter sp. CY323]|uniref:hypothetical protein n=1 Tax=Dyadobacter sp. CY323 TaxID=2907302 RepID=UPI001F25BBCE|nr:hypothetical protein [Dyadobacter sp. CY323]MCE6989435.1 hypothetical protein [Dyadobacter sp. CY323]
MNKLIYFLMVSFLISFDVVAYRSAVADTLVRAPATRSEVQSRGSASANLALTFSVSSLLASAFGLLSLGGNGEVNAAIPLTVGLIFSLLALISGIGGSWKYLKESQSAGLSDKSISRVRRKFGLSILLSLLGMTVMSVIVIALANF